VSEYAKTNNFEDYAETMMHYFYLGNDFRNTLKLARETESPVYEVLKAKYEFMREFFEGQEFSLEGKIFKPQIDDFIFIDDPDPYLESIPLAFEPPSVGDENINTEGTISLYDGAVVKIIDGPVEAHHEYMGMERNYYKVEFELSSGETVEGWISDIWFGGTLRQTN
jgi:hypothetical protein